MIPNVNVKINIFAKNQMISRSDQDTKSRNLDKSEAQQLANSLFPSLKNFKSDNISNVQAEYEFKQINNETKLGSIKIQHKDMGELEIDISARINSHNEIKLILQPKIDTLGFDLKFNNKALEKTQALKDITRLLFEKLEASIAYSNDTQLENDGNILNNSTDALQQMNASPFSIVAKDLIQKEALNKTSVPHQGAYTVELPNGHLEIQRYDQPFSISFDNSDGQTRSMSQEDYNALLERILKVKF